MGAASDADKLHVAPELRFDHRPSHNAWIAGAIGGHEAEPETGGYHGQSPVVALAPIGGRAGDALRAENFVGVAGKLAVDAMNVALAVKLTYRKHSLIREAVIAMAP